MFIKYIKVSTLLSLSEVVMCGKVHSCNVVIQCNGWALAEHRLLMHVKNIKQVEHAQEPLGKPSIYFMCVWWIMGSWSWCTYITGFGTVVTLCLIFST